MQPLNSAGGLAGQGRRFCLIGIYCNFTVFSDYKLMNESIDRPLYLEKLIRRRGNGEVKIITGMRRSGKSWLLKKIYAKYLIGLGVPEDHIISVSFDMDDDLEGRDLRDPVELKKYLYSRIGGDAETYYVFLDEVQMVEGFERIVNGLNARDNVDVYITGSNSRFLSSDINTIFRGRGDEIRVYPLTFKEFCSGRSESLNQLWKEYYTYGGMPALRKYASPEEKIAYLQRLWQKTYIDGVVERNGIRNRQTLEDIVDSLCSSIGSLTNAGKISNTLRSVMRIDIDSETIASYLRYLENSFLFEGSRRYNIKGKRYYESIKKYYAADPGLRNVRLNFRQLEPSHLMENIIYNELRGRGYLVDVGVVEGRSRAGDKSEYRQLEVDFVASDGRDKFYVQSAYAIPDEAKREQELASLRSVDDNFSKIVVVGDDIAEYKDDKGFVFVGVYDFLLRG